MHDVDQSNPLRLGEMRGGAELASRLIGHGLSPWMASAKAALFARAAEVLLRAGHEDHTGALAFHVPGRIEVLGKHTDYAGGHSLVAPVEQGFCLLAVPRRDNQVCIHPPPPRKPLRAALSPDTHPVSGHWSNYPLTVVRRLARNFPNAARGADIAFVGDLPSAAGVSSSSAMMIAFFLALADINNLPAREDYRGAIGNREDLAGYLGTVENGQSFKALTGDRGVGTFGGSEDHTAILCGVAGRLRQYRYCPLQLERTIVVPPGLVFAIAASGVKACKTGAAMADYNRASQLAAEAARVWREQTGRDEPHLAAVLAQGSPADEWLYRVLSQAHDAAFPAPALVARFQHFMTESEQLIPAAGDALAWGDLPRFGRLVERSQMAAEELLGNQVEQTMFLARCALTLGAMAASSFGAGFGGSVWALVPATRAPRFLRAWKDLYHAGGDAPAKGARFFHTHPGPPALALHHSPALDAG